MKIILFGASGMVGQGVLRECLQDADITTVLSVGRSPLGQTHEKLREIIHSDFNDFSFMKISCRGTTLVFSPSAFHRWASPKRIMRM